MLTFVDLAQLSALRRTTFGVMAVCAIFAACSSDGAEPIGDGDGDLTSTGGVSGDGDGGAPGNGDGDGDIPEYVPMGAPCEFGDDEAKCDGESAVACSPILGATGTSCDEHEDCGARELCFASSDPDERTGACMRLYGECLPRCGGDFDCDEGLSCDISSGACAEKVELGEKRFGESCESDEDCAGSCVAVDEGVLECEEHCRVGAPSGCGVEDLSTSEFACAYFAYTLEDFGEEQGAGDVGICAQLCDCTADCPGEQKCLERGLRGFAGVCTGGTVDSEIVTCPSTGEGGAGGAGAP